MRFSILSSLVATAALVPALSQAEGFSYSYLEGAYVNSDVDNFDRTIDGYSVRGSAEITKNIFLFGNFTDQSTSFRGNDFGLQAIEVGAGYAWPLASNLDLYGKVGYVHGEADVPGPNFDDDGYLVGVGLRGRVAERFDLEGGVKYRDLNDWGDETTVGVAARYFFTPQFAAGLEGEFGDDVNSYGVNVRWSFGK